MTFNKSHNEIVTLGTDMQMSKRPTFIHVLMIMALFLGMHNPQINVSLHIETSSISAENTPKHPSLEANNGIKFASRTQKTFKVKGNDNRDDTHLASHDIIAPSFKLDVLLGSKYLYTSYAKIIHARLLGEYTNVRAPPAIS